MNRNRFAAVAALLMLTISSVAQPSMTAHYPLSLALGGLPASSRTSAVDDGAENNISENSKGVPSVAGQMKLLTDRLGLNEDQQGKLKPILQELHDSTMKLIEDETMTPAQRMDHLQAYRWKVDKQMREFLTDDQKKRLDQVEQEPHPELHGHIEGIASPK